MRLIDADKLYKALAKPSDLPGDTIDVMVVRLAILAAPEVEAIPKEWLKKKYNEADNAGMGIDDWSVKDCYGYVIESWEKDNETN